MNVLQKHNQPVYERVVKQLEETKICVLETATGTGKSYIAMQYILDHGCRTLIIVPKVALTISWSKTIDDNKLSPRPTIMTYQSFMALKDITEIVDQYDLFILDEAHHSTSDIWGINLFELKRLVLLKNKYILELTADTKRYTEGTDVSDDFFDNYKIIGYYLHDAISNNILPSFRYISARYGLDKDIQAYKNHKDKKKKWNSFREADSNKLLTKLEFNIANGFSINNIIHKYLVEPDKHKIVVFVERHQDYKEAESLVRGCFPDLKIFKISSAYTDSENSRRLREFMKEKYSVVISINMLNEGLHIDGVDVLIMLRRTESPTVFYQQLGRVTSTNNLNMDRFVFDFVGNSRQLKMKSITEESTGDFIERFNNLMEDKEKQIIVDDYESEAVELLESLNELLGKNWTESEKEYLIKNYGLIPIEELVKVLNRSASGIKTMARVLKIANSDRGNKWTDEDIQIIKDNYGKKEAKEIQSMLSVFHTIVAIRAIAIPLGLQKRKSSIPIVWTDDMVKQLTELYPTNGFEKTAEIMNLEVKSIRSKTQSLKLRRVKTETIWTKDMLDKLHKEYNKLGTKGFAEKYNISVSKVLYKARQLNIIRERRYVLTDEIVKYIKDNPEMSAREIADKFDLNVDTLRHYIYNLRKGSNIRPNSKAFTDDKVEYVKNHPEMTTREILNHLNLNYETYRHYITEIRRELKNKKEM